MSVYKKQFHFIYLIFILIVAGLIFYSFLKNNSNKIISLESNSIKDVKSQPVQVSESTSAKCHEVNNELPDPVCTPGLADTNVTQDNISKTICVSGYTKTVRPSASVTAPEKLQSIQEYGYSDTNPSDYEYDHLISLELGGAANDVKNLWAEPAPSPNPKDKIENKLHSLVCNGTISLDDAQKRISTNWVTALNGY